MILLHHALVTGFHNQLATPGWLAELGSTLERFIADSNRFHSCNGVGLVTSNYNEERYMGPYSLCKFWFYIELSVPRAGATEPPDRLLASVTYKPDTGAFVITRYKIDTPESRVRDEAERLRKKAEFTQKQARLKKMEQMISAIKNGCAKDEVLSWSCPWCGGNIGVGFYPRGEVFDLSCSNPRCRHFSRTELLDASCRPAWWKEMLRFQWLADDPVGSTANCNELERCPSARCTDFALELSIAPGSLWYPHSSLRIYSRGGTELELLSVERIGDPFTYRRSLPTDVAERVFSVCVDLLICYELSRWYGAALDGIMISGRFASLLLTIEEFDLGTPARGTPAHALVAAVIECMPSESVSGNLETYIKMLRDSL